MELPQLASEQRVSDSHSGSHFSASVICSCEVPLLREKWWLNYSLRFVLNISVLSITGCYGG